MEGFSTLISNHFSAAVGFLTTGFGDLPKRVSRGARDDCNFMIIPSIYKKGSSKALEQDVELAESYIRHTTVGDPLADRVVEDLSKAFDPGRIQTVLTRALDQFNNPPPGTPESLRNLLAEANSIPDWYDPDIARLASRAFLRNPEIVLAGLATGAIVEGFSTLISKSFLLRGRIIDNGVRRLKQNNLHLLEQLLPGGQEPGGDGWRLTLRIRLVHAQTRMLIRRSGVWDESRFGTPISTAHILLGAVSFSARLMEHVARLGGGFSQEEREAYVHVWRYSGWILGIPEDLLFHDEASALHIFRIATLCEPEVGDDSIAMANSIINSVPVVLGVTEPQIRRAQVRGYYRISRALIGDELADQFRFPKRKKLPVLLLIRLRYRIQRLLMKLTPSWLAPKSLGKFNVILSASDLAALEHSYRLPTALYDEESDEW